jgi:glycosyltransferase involved in cell wall biosynthesis
MKIAFIYSFEQSAWKSCQTITQNLINTYRLIYPEKSLLHFDYNDDQTKFQKLELAQKLVESAPDKLVIVDHKPHLESLLKVFELVQKTKKRPEIVFHIFGDFTLYGNQWLKLEPLLKKYKVKFICASDKQQRLVEKFLSRKETSKLPFPVDEKSFYFSEQIRRKKRIELGLKDEIVLVYTGRLSLQKRVSELSLDFLKFIKESPHNCVLYLAGEFDDLGSPFTGIYFRNGEFYQRYLRILNAVPEKLRERVRLLGHQDQAQLLELYNAADIFISLSTHNDEDYGMSPAEALCTGLPAILSDWAGYSSFKLKGSASCSLIPVEIVKNLNQVQYNKAEFFSCLEKNIQQLAEHRSARKEYAKVYANEFSIRGNSSRLKRILEQPLKSFSGFSKLMKELANAFKEAGPPFIVTKTKTVTKLDLTQTNITMTTTKKTEFKPLYLKIYESYLSK